MWLLLIVLLITTHLNLQGFTLFCSKKQSLTFCCVYSANPFFLLFPRLLVTFFALKYTYVYNKREKNYISFWYFAAFYDLCRPKK